jgi:hypothetical protein
MSYFCEGYSSEELSKESFSFLGTGFSSSEEFAHESLSFYAAGF